MAGSVWRRFPGFFSRLLMGPATALGAAAAAGPANRPDAIFAPGGIITVAPGNITVVSGEAEMQGQRLVAGDIVVLEPGEITGFKALTDVVTTVVKIPGAKNDKYLV